MNSDFKKNPKIRPIQNPRQSEHDSKSLKNFIWVSGVLMKFKIDPYLIMKQSPIIDKDIKNKLSK